MIYEIMSKTATRQTTYEAKAPVTAIISITDPKDKPNSFLIQSWITGILELQFMDVDGGLDCMTKEQALKVARFAFEHYDHVERFIVHCQYGQSRSAGIAAALSEFFEGYDSGISSDSRYSPNWFCYKLVKKALAEQTSLKSLG